VNEIGLFEAIHTAKALRHLKPDPVPDELIVQVLDAAIRAPSGSNTQGWAFVVIKDPLRRARIGAIYRRGGEVFNQIYRDRPRPEHMSEKSYARLLADARYLFEHMGEAPVLVLACLATARRDAGRESSRPSPLAARLSGASIYPAVQNIILACRGLGLGTVLTTLHAHFEDEVKAELGLPAEVETYALLPIGFPQDGFGFGPVRRKPLNQVACLDHWGQRWPER